MENKACCKLKDVAVYHSSFLNKDFEIKALPPVDSSNYSVFVFCEPLPAFGDIQVANNNSQIKICFLIQNNDFNHFGDEIKGLSKQYRDMAENACIKDSTSEENNFITQFSPTTAHFYYDGKHYTADFTLQAYFRSLSDQYMCVLTSGPLTAKEDSTIKVEGLYMPFYELDSLDNFLKVIEEGEFNALNL